MTPEMEKQMLTNGRYLDENGKPKAGDASMAATDPAADPAAAASSAGPTEEYLRLPVRMQLVMDQRWLTHLIAECANQPLRVEVQQVRINPSDFGTSSGADYSMMGAGMGSGREGYGGGYVGGGRGGYEGAFGGGSTANLFPELTGVQTFSAQPNMVNVVVQGIIYIFNPPDASRLKVTEEPQVAMTAQ
jgi:hypothetical protein